MSAARPDIGIALDRSSAVPLYRQLAEELRYQIATGTLKVGDQLPPVAEAAEQWQVNLHTVRHAYSELAGWGVAEMRRAKGTFITAAAEDVVGGKGISSFLEWVAAHAKSEFGLDRQTLADLLTAQPARSREAGALCFVECSETQAEQHASELNAKFGAEVRGWSLDWDGEPPPGPFIATLFHYNDIRSRWPHRMKDAAFVSIQLASGLRRQLESYLARSTAPVILVEREEMMGRTMAADVSAVLDLDDAPLRAEIVQKPAAMKLDESRLYLFAPRLWSQLTDAQRGKGNVLTVAYEIPEAECLRLAHQFGWEAA